MSESQDLRRLESDVTRWEKLALERVQKRKKQHHKLTNSQTSSEWMFNLKNFDVPTTRKSQLFALIVTIVRGITGLRSNEDILLSLCEEYLTMAEIHCAANKVYCSFNGSFAMQDFLNIPRHRMIAIFLNLAVNHPLFDEMVAIMNSEGLDRICLMQCILRDITNMLHEDGTFVNDKNIRNPYFEHFFCDNRSCDFGGLMDDYETDPSFQTLIALFTNARSKPRNLVSVKGTNFIGLQMPDQTITPRELVRQFIYMRDVMQISEFVLFETKLEAAERLAWNLACRCVKLSFTTSLCDLIFHDCAPMHVIDIPDWEVPKSAQLVQFGELLIHARTRNLYMAGHCWAGLGRTGLMIMFVLMFSLQIFDFVPLLRSLGVRYRPEAVDEILRIMQKPEKKEHKVDALMLKFIEAFLLLASKIRVTRRSMIDPESVKEAQKTKIRLQTRRHAKHTLTQDEIAMAQGRIPYVANIAKSQSSSPDITHSRSQAPIAKGTSPSYSLSAHAAPAYRPASPNYSPSSPDITLPNVNLTTSQAPTKSAKGTSPSQSPTSPARPTYPRTSPNYSPSSPDITLPNVNLTNSQAPTKIVKRTSPSYSPSSPTHPPTSPTYSPSSPDIKSPKRNSG